MGYTQEQAVRVCERVILIPRHCHRDFLNLLKGLGGGWRRVENNASRKSYFNINS